MGGKFKQKKNFSKKTTPTSRKDLRKQLRKEKKAKRNEYFKNKKKTTPGIQNSSNDNKNKNKMVVRQSVKDGSSLNKNSSSLLKGTIKKIENTNIPVRVHPSFLEEQNKLHKQEIKEKAMFERGIIKQRKKMLLVANEEEDKEIKKLEKQLKLNKRKTKSVPKSFTEEGLDYLLEVCNTDKLIDAANAEMNLQESGSEFEDDFALITGNRKRKTKHEEISKKKKKITTSSSSEMEDSSKDGFTSDSENGNHSPPHGGDEEIDSNPPSEEEEFSEVDSMEKGTEGDDSEFEETELDGLESETVGDDGEASTDEGESEIDDCGRSADENSEMEDNDDKNDADSSQNKKLKNGMWEDIYGRLRDKQGNVVQEPKNKYIPPHIRAQQMGEDAKRNEEVTRLRKQMKGLINRLAESNIHSIANQIDQLYMRNSRNDMNDTLLSLITEVLVAPVLTAERLVMEHALLIAVLHANVGMEVGAHFLQSFVQKYNTMFLEGCDVENKELDNVLLIISHLYNFKVFHSVLMYNILDQLAERFSEKEVELILLVLRSVGFSLRKDDPLALKNLVLQLQKKAGESAHLRDNTRVKFMLDILLAVKNNNMAKIPQYDPSHSEHLKKLLKSLLQKGKYVTELKVTLEDLLKADERGRWWIVGSAWSGAPSTVTAPKSQPTHDSQFSQTLLEMARKQRMNTDTRRNIFCILMTAEDYLDAFEKLLRLDLKGQQEQEIVHVMVHCLLKEKSYNPYYAHLATHLCQANRKHQMSIQYHLWDKFKELANLNQNQITNLAKFLAHLFLEKALPISVLKVMQFSDMDKPCVRLLRQVLLSLLLSNSEEILVAVFARVSRSDKLHMFRESLRLFLHHFVLRNVSDLPPDQGQLVNERVRLAEAALMSEDNKIRFSLRSLQYRHWPLVGF